VSHDLRRLVPARGLDLQSKAMRKPLETRFVREHECGKSVLHVERHEDQAAFVRPKSLVLYAEMRRQYT
jgi:hypothetical protein